MWSKSFKLCVFISFIFLMGQQSCQTSPSARGRGRVNRGGGNAELARAGRNVRGSIPGDQGPDGSVSCQSPQNDFQCMMCNCHHEAGTESYQGKVAVNRVVMTRVRMGSYPNTVCGVIWQRAQFSWTLFRRHRNQPVSGQSYRNCYNAVQEAHQFNGHFASHYHANYVRPSWRRGCRGRFTIGVHHFYRSCGVQAPASPAGGGSEAVALLMTPEEGGHFAICHL